MALIATAVIQERKHIHVFLWTLILSLGFYGVKGGLFTIASGGGSRVWGPPDSLINGNNELAVALVMIVPLMYYLSTTIEKKWHRRALYGAIFLSTVAALGTQSRGALLAVLAMSSMLWLKSEHKWRLLIGVFSLALVIFAFMPESWWDRMATIGTYQEDGSAMGRVNAWQMAVNIALDRFTGAGFDAWTPLTYELYSPVKGRAPIVAHSIYFHVLGDHGFIGLALFLIFWFVTYRCANSIRRDTENIPALHWARDLSRMIQVGLVGYFVGGAFLSLAYWDVPYFVMVLLVSIRRYVSENMLQQLSDNTSRAPLNMQSPSSPTTKYSVRM
jgi:probable O-glycosylation ligase (exosortase A-associated)